MSKPFTDEEQREHTRLGAKWAAGTPMTDAERVRWRDLSARGAIGNLMASILDDEDSNS
jgi:hypothetical protein